HEQQRRVRREQEQRRAETAHAARNQRRKTFSFCAIANLIMVLNADHVRRGRHVPRRGAAWTAVPEGKRLALKNKAFIQSPHDLLWPAKILVVAVALAGEEGMNCVVKIVAPDCVEAISAALQRTNNGFIVLIRFGNYRHFASEF